MLIVTTNEIPGYRIDAVLGEVMGMTVRAANIGANFVASFRSIGGGEVKEYTNLVYDSRNEVMNRMWQQAMQRGANAIIGMRFDTGDIAQAFTEVCAYGTAVVVSPIAEGENGATPQSSEVARQTGLGAPSQSGPPPQGAAGPQSAPGPQDPPPHPVMPPR